jgi:hypothetical protein
VAVAVAVCAVGVTVWALTRGSEPAGTGGTNQPENRGDPPQAGQATDLVTPNKLPTILGMPDLHRGTVGLDPNGFCEVGTSDWALIELVRGPLAVPVVLEAEVAMTSGSSSSEAGVYFGRREWKAPGGVYEAFYQATVNGPQIDAPKESGPTGVASAYVKMLRPNAMQNRYPLFQPLKFDRPRFAPGQPPDWRTLRVRIDAEHLRYEFPGEPPRTVPVSFGIERMREITADAPDRPAFGPPRAGDGLGLFVQKGKALFRSVRLLPAPPE